MDSNKEIKITLPNELCTGCSACMNICPVTAISMQENRFGFIHPYIDPQICIKCHQCEKTCPVYVEVEKREPLKVFAVVSKQIENRNNYASGGLVTQLANIVLSKQGIVYGCFEENYKKIEHIRITDIRDIPKIAVSKYVQSDIDLIFKNVKQDLLDNKNVLFTGTPCQIAGLLNYLKKPYENLITVDLVCHGVPNKKMLENQIDSLLKNKFDLSNIKVSFRWKKQDKNNPIVFGLRLYKKDIQNLEYLLFKEENEMYNPYMNAFLKGFIYRESCYKCDYSCKKRVSDITAADFWGLGYFIPSNFDASKGVSLALLNTKKGLSIFNDIKENVLIENHTLEEACKYNHNLNSPTPKPVFYNKYFEYYNQKGITKAQKKFDRKFRFDNNALIKFLYIHKYSSIFIRLIIKVLYKMHYFN